MKSIYPTKWAEYRTLFSRLKKFKLLITQLYELEALRNSEDWALLDSLRINYDLLYERIKKYAQEQNRLSHL